METIDKQRMRASDAKDLIIFFGQFMNGTSARLEELRNGTPDDQIRVSAEYDDATI